MTLKTDILELIELIDSCDKAITILRKDPPLTLSFNERTEYIERFSREGAGALTKYYRLTRGLFDATRTTEKVA